MYKSFKVKNFRCFEKLSIENLKRVNLITGINNAGKTSLLEALFIHCGAYNPELIFKISEFRGMRAIKSDPGEWVQIPCSSLFYNFMLNNSIKMEGEDNISGNRTIELKIIDSPADLIKLPLGKIFNIEKPDGILSSLQTPQLLKLKYKQPDIEGSTYLILSKKNITTYPIPPRPPFKTFFQTSRERSSFLEEAELYGKLELENRADVLLDVLKIVEPGLKRLSIVVTGGKPLLHGDTGMGRLIPLPLMGEGLTHITSLILHISNAPEGVVIIDEIENGIHHSIFELIWEAINKVSQKFKTQIFATTHSMECIKAAHEAFKDEEIYDFALHRIEKIKEKIEVNSYDRETLESAIDIDLEVR